MSVGSSPLPAEDVLCPSCARVKGRMVGVGYSLSEEFGFYHCDGCDHRWEIRRPRSTHDRIVGLPEPPNLS
jgi:DNA-directed RNA polymerase subunit M/transcription elongation factor TFIIS